MYARPGEISFSPRVSPHITPTHLRVARYRSALMNFLLSMRSTRHCIMLASLANCDAIDPWYVHLSIGPFPVLTIRCISASLEIHEVIMLQRF
jgi:hypothetical protein